MIVSVSEKETIEAGKKFAEGLKPGSIIGLKGNLGTGKTQFVKGICEYFGVKDVVNSPTFILVNEYIGINGSGEKIQIYHFDLYRLKSASELEVIGFEEYIRSDSIVLIEWSEIAEEYLNYEIDTVLMDYGAKNEERIIKYAKRMRNRENLNILLLDTTTRKIEFAYNKKSDFCILKTLDNSKNADDLIYEIKSEFDEQEFCFQDIDFIGLANGPGSYTGLRIGSAISKAMCLATGAELIEINSLDLIAEKYYMDNNYKGNVMPLIFSGMKTGEFYFAVFEDGKRITDYKSGVQEEIEKNDGLFLLNDRIRYDFPDSMKIINMSENSNLKALYGIAMRKIEDGQISDFRTSEPFYMKQFLGS